MVFSRTQGSGTNPHLIAFFSCWNSLLLACGPLPGAWPITTNTNSHNLQVPHVFRCAFMLKPMALKPSEIVTKAASCTPSCGSSVRRWVASRTKQASELDVALFHQVQIRRIGVHFGKNGHDFRLYSYRILIPSYRWRYNSTSYEQRV